MAPNLGRPRFEDYPYDPAHDDLTDAQLSMAIQSLQGLDRLRAVKNRVLAKYLFELWFYVKDPSARELEAERAEKEAEDLACLESMTDKAMNGVYGPKSQSLARSIVMPHRNAVTMRQLRLALHRIQDRISG